MSEVLGASVAILVPDLDPDYATVITIQRDNYDHIPYPGRWEVPGGTIDPGENAVECVIRETYEEVGVTLPEEAVVWMGLYRSMSREGAYNAFFVARLQNRPKLQLGSEGRATKFMWLGDFLGPGEVIPDHSDRLWDYMIRNQGSHYPDGGIYIEPFRTSPTSLGEQEFRDVRTLALQRKTVR